MTKRLSAAEVEEQFAALQITLEKEAADVFSKGEDTLKSLPPNQQVRASCRACGWS